MYYYGMFDPTYVLVIIGVIITLLSQVYMQSTFNTYQSIRSRRGFSAYDVAMRIMSANGIDNVQIGRVSGNLTDHYAPTKKELNLSDTTYNSSSIASVGVAAHEVGHAIQDNRHYFPLVFQMSITPALSFISQISMPMIMIGLILGYMRLFELGIIAFSATLVYQIITLPIEFDASRRAIVTLSELNILDEDELYGVKKVLTAAALTYVAAAASTMLQLFRLVLLARRRD